MDVLGAGVPAIFVHVSFSWGSDTFPEQRALADEYRHRYLSEVLDRVDLQTVLESFPDEAVSALLCVERDARACHRSLVAERLHEQFGVPVVNL